MPQPEYKLQPAPPPHPRRISLAGRKSRGSTAPPLGGYNRSMRFVAILLASLAAAHGQPRGGLESILRRVSEEAEVFARAAPETLADETLRQRVRKAPARFRPRVGASAVQTPPVAWRSREIVSEYTFAAFQDSPRALHEFRQVVSVDGRAVATKEKARRTLFFGVQSKDDDLKRRMLREFENYGLVGAVADFGQSLLMFRKRPIANYRFEPRGTAWIGAEGTAILDYEQIAGSEAVTIFEGNRALHQRLRGQLWVRRADSLPMRITIVAEREKDGVPVADEATVEYRMSQHGVILPVSIIHRQKVRGELVTENVFRYSQFRKFSADSAVKFTEVNPGSGKP